MAFPEEPVTKGLDPICPRLEQFYLGVQLFLHLVFDDSGAVVVLVKRPIPLGVRYACTGWLKFEPTLWVVEGKSVLIWSSSSGNPEGGVIRNPAFRLIQLIRRLPKNITTRNPESVIIWCKWS